MEHISHSSTPVKRENKAHHRNRSGKRTASEQWMWLSITGRRQTQGDALRFTSAKPTVCHREAHQGRRTGNNLVSISFLPPGELRFYRLILWRQKHSLIASAPLKTNKKHIKKCETPCDEFKTQSETDCQTFVLESLQEQI